MTYFQPTCLMVSDNTLLVGTKQGQLLVYTVQPTGSHEPRFNVLLERANKAFSKKPITQLADRPRVTTYSSVSQVRTVAVLPKYHILISLSGQDQWQSCPSDHILISLSGQDSGSLAQVPHIHQSLRSGPVAVLPK